MSLTFLLIWKLGVWGWRCSIFHITIYVSLQIFRSKLESMIARGLKKKWRKSYQVETAQRERTKQTTLTNDCKPISPKPFFLGLSEIYIYMYVTKRDVLIPIVLLKDIYRIDQFSFCEKKNEKM